MKELGSDLSVQRIVESTTRRAAPASSSADTRKDFLSAYPGSSDDYSKCARSQNEHQNLQSTITQHPDPRHQHNILFQEPAKTTYGTTANFSEDDRMKMLQSTNKESGFFVNTATSTINSSTSSLCNSSLATIRTKSFDHQREGIFQQEGGGNNVSNESSSRKNNTRYTNSSTTSSNALMRKNGTVLNSPSSIPAPSVRENVHQNENLLNPSAYHTNLLLALEEERTRREQEGRLIWEANDFFSGCYTNSHQIMPTRNQGGSGAMLPSTNIADHGYGGGALLNEDSRTTYPYPLPTTTPHFAAQSASSTTTFPPPGMEHIVSSDEPRPSPLLSRLLNHSYQQRRRQQALAAATMSSTMMHQHKKRRTSIVNAAGGGGGGGEDLSLSRDDNYLYPATLAPPQQFQFPETRDHFLSSTGASFPIMRATSSSHASDRTAGVNTSIFDSQALINYKRQAPCSLWLQPDNPLQPFLSSASTNRNQVTRNCTGDGADPAIMMKMAAGSAFFAGSPSTNDNITSLSTCPPPSANSSTASSSMISVSSAADNATRILSTNHSCSYPHPCHKSLTSQQASTSSLSHHNKKSYETRAKMNKQDTVMTLKTDSDVIWLSPFLCFLREECCEVYKATQQDVMERRKSKQVKVNQVGIRCRFCSHLPHNGRIGRSSCFPSSMDRIYQSVTMMIREHFSICQEFPDHVRAKYKSLKEITKKGEMESKTHWKNAAKDLGLVDVHNSVMKGIFFEVDMVEDD